MSGRIGFGSRTHAFVTYEVIVSIVRANRYRPAEEGRIPGKGSKANLPHWAPRMTSIVIYARLKLVVIGAVVVVEEKKKTMCEKMFMDAGSGLKWVG
jgi:hypothetical protein